MQHETSQHFPRSSEEIFELARMLSAEFPKSREVLIGIYELLMNAVEHGTLGLEKQNKTDLLRNGLFHKEITKRLALPENKNKYIEVECAHDDCFVHLCIRDMGNGFDWHQHIPTSPSQHEPHGRGLLLAQACGFDAVTFNDEGNAVTCYARCTDADIVSECHYTQHSIACEAIRCSKCPSSVL